MTTHDGRITRLEERIRRRRCQTCWGSGATIVLVPEGEDADSEQYNPNACPECGKPYRVVRQIIGISEEEMFPERFGKAG